MSCDLLEKLAPETRTLIYKYVLTFNTPLKHVHKMRPFVEKSGQNTESAESNKCKTETSSSEEPPTANDSFNRVNASLLTTCKLVYKEAIAVFYKLNTIAFDTAICKLRNLLALHTSDLSLATQVTVESVMKIDPANGRTDGLGEVATFSAEGFWLVFPKLKAVTVYVYTDAHPLAVSALFAITAKVSSTPGFEGVKFDGVGSAIAYPNWPTLPTQHTKFTLVVQCRKTVDRWANARVAFNADDLTSISMRLVHDNWKEDNAPGSIDPIAHDFFTRTHDLIVPVDYPVIEHDSYEYWTVADEGLRQMQLAFQRQQVAQAAQAAPVEDASSDSDSDSDYVPSSDEEDDEEDENDEEDGGRRGRRRGRR